VAVRRGRLWAAELDARGALDRWLGANRADLEILAERGTYLDRGDVHRLLDLTLPGADELIGLLELLRLAGAVDCERVVVDTAPTGHTLRLLAMPEEMRRFAAALDRLQGRHRVVAETFSGARSRDGSDGLITEIEAQGKETADLLRDPERTQFHWVLLPEALSVAETRDGVRALEASGIAVSELIVNRVTPPPESPCALCDARRQAEKAALDELKAGFPGAAVRFVPEQEREPRGVAALRRIRPSPPPLSQLPPHPRRERGDQQKQRQKKKGLELDFLPRLVFFGGKGGVGKTTCAIAAALQVAARRPEERVLLLSTDPAHSLGDGLKMELGDDERSIPGAPSGLRVRELDAVRTFAEWRARHLDGLEEWRDLLDLAPPGLDELSAVSTLIDAVPVYDRIIVDTAPTGHTLRLLEAPAAMLAWVQALLSLLLKYRETVGLGSLASELVEMSRGLRHFGELLRDPAETGFVVVTRAAELPRRESVRLLAALARLGIAVPAVIVDAVTPPGCPRCDRIARTQEREIGRLRVETKPCAIIVAPAVVPPPRGVRALKAWGRTWETRPA
jgi:arsenite/tail-anchored protein-transporting ATPase